MKSVSMSISTNIIILTLALSLSACFAKKSNTADTACNSSSCIDNICPGYSTSSYDSSDTEVCSFQGSCEIPNMPLTYQLNLQIPGNDIACGPVAVQMIMNSVISKSGNQTSGWSASYSSIAPNSDPTGSSTGYCANDKDCRQVLSIGSELINASWASNPKRVSATETALFFEQRANEISNEQGSNAKEYESSIFPTDINACTFASGDQALSNNHPWTYSVLYLEYPVNTSSSSTYNNTELVDITLREQVNGHYIALKGYQASTNDISFKFHDPIYGIRFYTMVNIKEDEPVCIERATDSTCSLYLRIKELPYGFKGAGTFLVANQGEEKESNYIFKFIAAVSGISAQ